MKVLRPEVIKCLKSHTPGAHGLNDLMDDMFLSALNMTDNEFDFMLENLSEDENEFISVIFEDDASFSDKKKMLEIRNNYLKLFNERDGINNDLHL